MASKKNYTMGNDVLLELAQVFSSALSTDLALFTTRFPWLDAAWQADFEADIAAANGFPSDLSIKLDNKVITSDLLAAMKQAYGALQALACYGRLAWPNDRARQRVFGQDRWRQARRNTLLLAEALELAHSMAQHPEFKPALLAKGCTQPELDQLATMATMLLALNGQQESAKSDRKVKKNDRIVLLNAVWERMTTLSICAEVLWPDDAERRAQYQRYRPRPKKMASDNVADSAPVLDVPAIAEQ